MERFLICAIFFYAASAGSYPGRVYNTLTMMGTLPDVPYLALLTPALLCGGLLLLVRGRAAAERPRGETPARAWEAPLALWFAAAVLSSVCNDLSPVGWEMFLTGYLAPLVVYVALRGVEVDRDLYRAVALSITLGALFPLVAGLAVWVEAWGTPTFFTLLASYKNNPRMQPYLYEMFGHRSSAAMFLLLVLPVMVSPALDARTPRWQRALFAAALPLWLLHMTIVQQRAAAAFGLIAIALIVWMRRDERFVLPVAGIALATLLGVLAFNLDALGEVGDRYAAAFLVQESDQSVSDRLEAMSIGWTKFEENPVFGIGLGETLTQMRYTTAHQLHVQQAAELGIGAFVATIWLGLVMLAPLVWPFRRVRDEALKMRFTLICGPVIYLSFGAIANAILAQGVTNTWAVLLVGLMALAGNPICVPEAQTPAAAHAA